MVQQLLLKPTKKVATGKAKKLEADPDAARTKQMEADFTAGQFEDVLRAWPELQNVTSETLKMLVRCLLELQRLPELPELLQTALELNCELRTPWTMNAVL